MICLSISNSAKAAPSETSQLPSINCFLCTGGSDANICSYLPSSARYGLSSSLAGINLRVNPSEPLKASLGGEGSRYLFFTHFPPTPPGFAVHRI